MKQLSLIAALGLLLACAGCNTFRFPGVHRLAVQQGNVVTQQMIDRLKPGMTKRQVQFVLGNPVLEDPLDRERWDYVYTFQIVGGPILRKLLSLYFIEEKLSYFEGNYLPAGAPEAVREIPVDGN